MPSRILLGNGTAILTYLVIVAVGIRARTLLSKQAGLLVGKTGASVDSFLQTSDPNIYAVGDMIELEHRIADRPMQLALAGQANRQGRLAAGG